MKEQKHITLRLPIELYRKLDKTATKDGCSLSEAMRNLMEKQLCKETLKADEDMIREYIRAEIVHSVEPYLKRIVAINAKSAISSASAWILCGRTLENFIAPHLQEEYHEVMSDSHKGAVAYIREKDTKVQDVIDGYMGDENG